MCGIAGIYSYRDDADSVSEQELSTIRDAMVPRGPDDQGLWLSDHRRAGLAHRRLAIIDPGPAGHQPMQRDSLVITFNGEIYNYQELMDELKVLGHRFKTHSDTEVILALYQEMGPSMLDRLSGMFALAIWDQNRQELFLARDPYGIKPLYYSNQHGAVRFASSVRALSKSPGVSAEFNPTSEIAFLMLGYVPEPATIFSEIKSVEAGHYIVCNRQGILDSVKYASIADQWGRALSSSRLDLSRLDLESDISVAFRESVTRHLVSDVPLGVFLSAGIDSGAIAGLAAESITGKICSTTLGFPEFDDTGQDETKLAREVADYYGLEHHTRVVTENEMSTDLADFFEAMDQPTVDGLNSWFISKSASEMGIKVMLSGIGGDELLGSYPAFTRIPKLLKYTGLMRRFPQIGERISCLRKYFPYYALPPKSWGVFNLAARIDTCYLLNRGIFMPWELPALVEPDRLEAGLTGLDIFDHIGERIQELDHAIVENVDKKLFLQAQISTLESSLYMRNQLLRDADWASMAHSVEVRTPLVDYQLLKTCSANILNLNHSDSKSCLANSPEQPLPEKIQHRKKTGFTTPVNSWLKTSELLDGWKSVAILRNAKCHWSRRHVYSVLKTYQQGVG